MYCGGKGVGQVEDDSLTAGHAGPARARTPTKRGSDLRRCRLCRRITAAVFLSILLIEAVILIPSYRNYERDRIGEFVRAAVAAVTAGYKVAGTPVPGDTVGSEIADALIGTSGLRGIIVIDDAGDPVFSAGAPVSPATVRHLLLDPQAAIQAGRDSVTVLREYPAGRAQRVILDVATPTLTADLRAFVWRIAGLVGLIAMVVTAATMLVLRATILAPLVDLEASLAAAARDPHGATCFQVRSRADRRDEMGTLVDNVNWLLRSVSTTLVAISKHERELADLNATLEERVRARTRELEAATSRAEAANEAKSKFLANMSHELRTPLNAIIGFADVMDNACFGPLGEPRYQAYARDILESGRHLLGVIDDVLDISRIEAGAVELSESEIELTPLVREALRITAISAESKGVDLADLLDEEPGFVSGDARLLRQAVLNLLSNAINFTPAGGRVEVSAVRATDGAVGIRIADNGIGIARDDLPKVLQPFGQVADVMARTHQGTGLGLPLTRRFVELHGGRLEIDSTVGVGTTAVAWLPACRCHHAALRSPVVAS